MVNLVTKEVGGHYAFLLLFWEWVRYSFRVCIPWYDPGPNRICSTLWVVNAYRAVGIDLCPGIKFPSPADVAQSRLLRKIGTL